MKEKTPDPVLEKTAQAAAQVKEAASQAGQYAAENTPESVRDKAGQAAMLARANHKPLLAAAAVLVVFLWARRGRGRRR